MKKMGHVVGFLGDGVNDAPAMHAADTNLSVDQAVDVAREAADFVLLEHDLDVIRRGIEEGRVTFANTLKYVLTTTSAEWADADFDWEFGIGKPSTTPSAAGSSFASGRR